MAQQSSKKVSSPASETGMLETALSVLGLSTAAAQTVIGAYQTFLSSKQHVTRFLEEKKMMEEIREYLELEGKVLKEVQIDQVIQAKLEENQEETMGWLQYMCSSMDSFDPDSQCVVNEAAEKKMNEAEEVQNDVQRFQEQLGRFTKELGDEAAIQERANDLLKEGFVLGFVSLGIGFMTLLSACDTYSKSMVEMEDIRADLDDLKQNTLDELVEKYEQTRRVNPAKLYYAEARLECMQRRIKKRIAQAKDERWSLGMNSVINACNAAANAYKFWHVGRLASTGFMVAQGALAVGQAGVSLGSAALARDFHYSLDDWDRLYDEVSAQLAQMKVLQELVDVDVSQAA